MGRKRPRNQDDVPVEVPLRLSPALRASLEEGELTGYLAPAGFEADLEVELPPVMGRHGRLLLAPGEPRPAAWTQNTWRGIRLLEVDSIKDAARQLRAIQRNWVPYPVHLHRRSALVQEELPHVSARPLRFPEPVPRAPLGSWTFIDRDHILVAADCSSPFPNGDARFVEDHENPPSRAYLKLWETFTLFDLYPEPGARCLDLGASPGGWTWVLNELGCNVVAVDKAGLDDRLLQSPHITVRRESAFGLAPEEVGDVDWFFSDIICYPSRLLKLVQRFLAAGTVCRFVCTLKFQGETDHETARAFAAISNSRLVHLSCNKHELTWVKWA